MSRDLSVADIGVAFEAVEEHLKQATATLFGLDPQTRSVGIARHGSGFGLRVVLAREVADPSTTPGTLGGLVAGLPVRFTAAPAEPRPLLLIANSGSSHPTGAPPLPETQRHRPLVCGLQIQNLDDDARQGVLAKNLLTVGTLGCFVTLRNGESGLISNNHVVAGGNRGQCGWDHVLQPGAAMMPPEGHIGILEAFVQLIPSDPGTTVANGRARLNVVDCAVVQIRPGLGFRQAYLAFRDLPAPNGVGHAQIGDRVFKVGRTTGLTVGEVTEVGTTVGPVHYELGPCWFRNSFIIESLDGSPFAEVGDSGAAILRPTGEVIGLLYAGNGWHSYACPIDEALRQLGCSLATCSP